MGETRTPGPAADGKVRPAPAGGTPAGPDAHVPAVRPVPDVLGYLAGRWHVERTVRDLATGDTGSFTGATVFEPLPDGGLLHRESGTFVWQGVARPAERTLRFLPGPTPAEAEVRFADGRFFHGLDLRTGRHRAEHPCAADLYRGEYRVLGSDRWELDWRVGGPAKDLLLSTRYRRDTGSG